MNERAFGLPNGLFTSKKDYDLHYEAFQDMQEDIKAQRKLYGKQAEGLRQQREYDEQKMKAA